MTGKIMNNDKRPWGEFETLSHEKVKDDSGVQSDLVIKKITVHPGKRLSYQSHVGRNENWNFLSGEGVATLEGKEVKVKSGSNILVKKGQKHRISNIGNSDLVFIEESTGDFDEDDIIRYEDDFGRESK